MEETPKLTIKILSDVFIQLTEQQCKISEILINEFHTPQKLLQLENEVFDKEDIGKEDITKIIQDYLYGTTDLKEIEETLLPKMNEPIFINLYLIADRLGLEELSMSMYRSFLSSFDVGQKPENVRKRFSLPDEPVWENKGVIEDEIDSGVWSNQGKVYIDSVFVEETNLNASIVIDHNQRPLQKIGHLYMHLKSRKHFVPVQENQDTCVRCTSIFSTLNRDHHCRICSKTFCSRCIDYAYIPEHLRFYTPEATYWVLEVFKGISRQGQEPVCKDCMGDVKDNVPKLTTAFMKMGLPLDVLKKIATVTPAWRRASLRTLSSIRRLQYSFPSHQYTKYEKRILWNNRSYWAGHDKWLVQFLKIVDWNIPEQAKIAVEIANIESPITSCWDSMCTSKCKASNNIETDHVLELLSKNITAVQIREIALRSLEKATLENLSCYLPYLVNCIRYEHSLTPLTFNFLLKRVLEPQNQQLRIELFWQLCVAEGQPQNARLYSLLKNKLILEITGKLGKLEAESILKGYEIIDLIENLKDPMDPLERDEDVEKISAALENGIVNPLDSNLLINSLNNKLEKKDSANAPTVVKCTCIKNPNVKAEIESKEKINYSLLFKPEDLRKDMLVMNLIIRVNQILKENGIDCKLVTYKILPTSKDSGVIQIVQNSTTLYDIHSVKQYDNSLWNYFRLENTEEKGWNWKKNSENFFISAAGYSVLSYLLGLGDRHLDNIMVTKDGNFFHIDYGFILGEEPIMRKAYSIMNGGTQVRIPKNLKLTIECGTNEDGEYTRFCAKCVEIYTILRKHYMLFTNLLSLLHEAEPAIPYQYTQYHNKVEEEIVRRFLPGTSDEDAKKVFKIIVETSGESAYMISDITHHVKRQKALYKAAMIATGTIRSSINLLAQLYPGEKHYSFSTYKI